MIEHVVILADNSATLKLGGLTQLERLLFNVDETLAPAARELGSVTDVTVLWSTPELCTDWQAVLHRAPRRVTVRHAVNGDAPFRPAGGQMMVLCPGVVLGRDTFRRQLRARQAGEIIPLPAFELIGAEQLSGAWSWEALRGLVGSGSGESADTTHGFIGVLERAEDVGRVERALFRSLSKPTDGLVSRALNRPISTRLSRPLARWGVTPNQMTLAVLGVLFLSAAVMVTGHFVGFVIGTILYQVASVLDGCDGEIARVRFLESPRGAALDTSVDLFGHQLFVLALGIGLWRYWALAPNAALTYLWEGILTAVGIALALKGVARFSPRPGATEFHDFGESVVRKSSIPGVLRPMAFFIAALLRRDSYALIFVFLAAYGRPEWVLHCLAIGVAAHFPGIAWLWWKQSGFSVPRDARTVPGA